MTDSMSTGVTAPVGFKAAATAAGIYPDRPDMALIVADAVSDAAAVFTRNIARAAPVIASEKHVAGGRAKAVLVNAGCANAATSRHGIEDAVTCSVLAARELNCLPEEILIASTGVIGVRLPMEKMARGIISLARNLDVGSGAAAARAILTTDTKPKESMVEFTMAGRTHRIGGMAKGSGMIAPNMATMLAFLTTDVSVPAAILRPALQDAVERSFNRITVDGDTSTNDMVTILAGGRSDAPAIPGDGPDLAAFREALNEICTRLATMIVRDGEGATRIAEITVMGAATDVNAARIARTIAESPLVKTALNGGDPNWGRILAAAGRAGVGFDPDRVEIRIGNVTVMEKGTPLDYDEAAAAAAMREDPVRIHLDLQGGAGAASMMTTDLSHGYIDINAHYRS